LLPDVQNTPPLVAQTSAILRLTERQFDRASLILVGSVGRVEREVSVVMGCSARLSSYFCAGADGMVAARGLLDGHWREQARRRASASAEGGGYQSMRWSNSKAGRTGAADRRPNRAPSRRPPKVTSHTQVRSFTSSCSHPILEVRGASSQLESRLHSISMTGSEDRGRRLRVDSGRRQLAANSGRRTSQHVLLGS